MKVKANKWRCKVFPNCLYRYGVEMERECKKTSSCLSFWYASFGWLVLLIPR